jgi:imidazolonepropionase-like amidohydrolase
MRHGAALVSLCAVVFTYAGIATVDDASRLVAQSRSPGAVTVFEGATVIVGDGSAPIDRATFVVEGTKFTQVGRAGQVRVPAGATRVDLTGKTVMPGVIDTHTHPPATREALVDYLQRKAYYGSTVAMSLGLDPGDVAFEVRQQTPPDGARLLSAGRGITMPEPGRSDVPYWVTSAADARKAVQELATKKVDLVKIWVDDRGGKYKKLTPELYGAVIDEAHKRGLRVTAHVYYLEDAKGLLRAGIDAFAHGVRDKDVDEEFMTLVKQHPKLVLVPNLPDRGVPTDYTWLRDSVSAEELQKLEAAARPRPEAQAAFGIQARNLAKLHAAGVKIAFGTDGGIPWSHHVELEDMVAAGMPPSEVIAAATSHSAEFLALPGQGTVAPGKVADFVVLNGNPLTDITNTRKISAVYARGTAIDRQAPRTSGSKSSSSEPYAKADSNVVDANVAAGQHRLQ